MRDYLYLWHQLGSCSLIASGIEFRDLIPELITTGGLVLIHHGYDGALYRFVSGFDFVPADDLATLAADNIYEYGDFCWVDISRDVKLDGLGGLNDQTIAELAFFGHTLRPLNQVEIPGMSNHFLYAGHDDGWNVRIFYARWSQSNQCCTACCPTFCPRSGRCAYSIGYVREKTRSGARAAVSLNASRRKT